MMTSSWAEGSFHQSWGITSFHSCLLRNRQRDGAPSQQKFSGCSREAEGSNKSRLLERIITSDLFRLPIRVCRFCSCDGWNAEWQMEAEPVAMALPDGEHAEAGSLPMGEQTQEGRQLWRLLHPEAETKPHRRPSTHTCSKTSTPCSAE